MEDYASSDEDFQYSDQDSDDAFVNEEDSDFEFVTTKGPTTKVFEI